MQPTQDGGYILGGSSSSDNSGDKTQANKGFCEESNCTSDFWIVKVNANGGKEWDKTFGGNLGDGLAKIEPTSDGGYILAGSSNSSISGDKSEANKGGVDIWGEPFSDFWIVKIKADGTKEWDKTLGGNGIDRLVSVHQTSDSGYVMGGTAYSGLSGDKTENSKGGPDYWIVKVKPDGTKDWDKTFGGNSNDELATMKLLSDGSYLLGGTSYSGVSGNKTEPSRGGMDYWLIKLEAHPFGEQWNMRYGGTGTDNLTSVIKTQDGGYLSGGFTNSGATGDKTQGSQGKNDYWIVKSDKNGKKEWDKRYGGSQDDYLNRVIQTSDGGYLLGGSSFSGKSGDKSEESKGKRDYWVVKVDATGNKQWDKTFGGSGYDELKKFIQLASGEYVLGGHSNSPVSRDKSQQRQGSTDYWLVKISSTGKKIWDQRYGGEGEETLGSFVETTDGGFLLGGGSLSGKSGNKEQASQGTSDYWVVRTDKEGNIVWEKTFGGKGEDEIYSVRQISGGHFYLAGTSTSGNEGDKSQEGQGGKDYWLVKLNENGKKVWDRTFGGSKDDELRASTYSESGHYILAGHSNSEVSGDKSQASQGESDYWVVEVDENGNKIQDQRYGGSGSEELRTVTQTKDGGLLLGGRSNSGVSGDHSQPSQGSTDYWLVKVDFEPTSMLAARHAIVIEEPIVTTELSPLKANPNPFSEKIHIQFKVPQAQLVQVKVYDLQGRAVATLFDGIAQANQNYHLDWLDSQNAAGIYFLQLQTPTKYFQKKLLKER